ncbi:MAG TPA: lipopolysaccharide biosynthesis protein [Acetobacteraceae bacterium]|nr:lipopolysaccharide biosynthesis protein [Acetobacteraceae bacterium]
MSVMRDIFSGTAWAVAARWIVRGIGVISMVVLARLLSPVDFGVVAMAIFIVGLIEVLGDAGLALQIIRHPDPQCRELNTVFTLELLIGLTLCAVMILVAPIGAAFFHEPRLTLVIRVMALRPILTGLQNPGIALFRKNMTFNKDFEFLVWNKVVSFFIVLGLAITLRNYWALVIGTLAASVIATVQSYRIHPFRPRLQLSGVREIWGFSFWILVQNLFGFLDLQMDRLVIGRVKSTVLMGYYTVAGDTAFAPVREVVMPVTRVLFPGVVRMAGDRGTLGTSFNRVLAGVAIASLSISAGIALIAHDATTVFFGPRWTGLGSLLSILALSEGLSALSQPLYTTLNALGRPRVVAGLNIVRQVLLLATAIPAAIYAGVEAVALARVGVGVVTFVLMMVLHARLLRIDAVRPWRSLGRPVVAALMMASIVLLVQAAAPNDPALRMVLSVATGAAAFPAALLLLWQRAGRPAGIEADLLAVGPPLLHGLRRRAWQRS